MKKGLLTLGIVMAILAVACAVEMLCDRFRPRTSSWLRLIVILVLTSAIGIAFVRLAPAHDAGQWGDSDAAIREWYQGLMQPDNPTAPCCGEADAYWADEIHVRDGKTYATVTDDRPDAPRHRPHVDVGTEFEIPNHKLKWDRSNPTGHGVLFLSRQGFVYCFVQGGGV